MTAHQRLARLARRQHGAFASWQLPRLGITPAVLQTGLRRGTFVRLRRGVYAYAGAPTSQHQAVMAAVLAAGSEVLASHDTGLWVDGLRRSFPDEIEVTSSRAQHVRIAGLRSHRVRPLLRQERSVRHRIPVTSVARILIDVSGRYSLAELEQMVDTALRTRILRLEDLRFLVAGLRAGRGRDLLKLRTILAARLPGYDPCESELEAHVLRVLVEAGLPEPKRQVRLVIDGRRCRVDLAYEFEMITMECDGFEHHGGVQRGPFDADRARAAELVDLGYTHFQFTSRTPDDDIVRWVGNALRRARERRQPDDARDAA